MNLQDLHPFVAVGRSVRAYHMTRHAHTVATVSNPKILREYQSKFAEDIADALNKSAAFPDLLSACRAALHSAENGNIAAIDVLRAAIAKAEG